MRRRLKLYWYHIVLPLSIWLYLPLLFQESATYSHLQQMYLILSSVILTAASGYLLNDLFDQRTDRLAGKFNFFNYRPGMMHAMGLLVLAATVGVWYIISPSRIVLGLLGFEALLLLIYSLPGIQLKGTWAGAITDSLYSRVVPAIVLCLLLFPEGAVPGWFYWISMVVWLLISGLRNILLHQVDDRKHDDKSASKNLIRKLGPLSLINFLWRYLFPLELLAMLVWSASVYESLPGLPVVLIAALLCQGWLYWIWEKPPGISNRWLKLRSAYFLNEFYEAWIPMIILAYLAVQTPWAWAVMGIHLVLFYALYPKYLHTIWGFRGLVRYRTHMALSRLVNFPVYYFFRIFGVDLKKEGLSAMGYIKKLMGHSVSAKTK